MFRKVIFSIIIIILIAFYDLAPSSMDVQAILIVLVLVLFSLITFFSRKEKVLQLKGHFLKHSNLFVLGFLIVHFQLYTDFALGYIDRSFSFIWVNNMIVLKSMILSSIGLLSFFLGFLIYKKKIQHSKDVIRIKIEKPVSVIFLKYLASIILVIYFYSVNPLYLLGFYGSEYMGTTATYMELLFNLLVFSIIIQTCRNLRIQNRIPTNFRQYIKFMSVHLLILLVVYLTSVLMSGNRGPLVVFSLCYLSGYFFIKKIKFSYKQGFLLIFSGAFIISLLGTARHFNKDLNFIERVHLSFISNDTQSQASFSPMTTELAGSVRTLHHAVNYVPDKHDFLYGRFQFQKIIVVFPFFATFNTLIFDDNSVKYGNSSSFITWIRQGVNSASGDGTSCIADFYLDFGLYGVLIGMFLFGYFIRFAEINLYTVNIPSLFPHIFIIVYLCSAFYIPRSSVLFELRSVVWIFSILLLNKLLVNRKLS